MGSLVRSLAVDLNRSIPSPLGSRKTIKCPEKGFYLRFKVCVPGQLNVPRVS